MSDTLTLKNALIVDDSKSARYGLRKLLEKLGLKIDMAESGEEALSYLGLQKPDIIFLDHQMPGMDGFQTATAIKSIPVLTNIPLIMCSSHEGQDFFQQAKEHGFYECINKPADPIAVQSMLLALSSQLSELENTPIAGHTPIQIMGQSGPRTALPSTEHFNPDAFKQEIMAESQYLIDQSVERNIIHLLAHHSKAYQKLESIIETIIEKRHKELLVQNQYVLQEMVQKQIEDSFSVFSQSQNHSIVEGLKDIIEQKVENNLETFRQDNDSNLKQLLSTFSKEMHDNLALIQEQQGFGVTNESTIAEITTIAQSIVSEQSSQWFESLTQGQFPEAFDKLLVPHVQNALFHTQMPPRISESEIARLERRILEHIDAQKEDLNELSNDSWFNQPKLVMIATIIICLIISVIF